MLSPPLLTITALLASLTTLTTSSPVPQNSPPPMATSIPTPITLQPGAYWIRAVVPPNYHKYLQTKPANLPGTAILDSYTTAGQFNIVDGQLVNKVSNPPLYLWVEEPPADGKTNPPPRTLATWFNTTRNPFGTFAWQGDTLTWSVASIKRQNVAAWLVCDKKDQGALFVNTGAYGYQTPSGCADQTIHYYNDKTANN
ncbi:hypothetical protein GE21DRAFT_10535 [Neurospora crassa]|uniref:Uncharacterized protein n=1 Tax=Neurospora crassa (strain ATCC 24698 / 74-OR23-1A / CBS 708.71 / DSM 1257 / FGSC 987) TaxID=367110 RepID=Q7S4D1_NEUCR|nr:hypothetical protein NCU02189 [Neurospora crassa OR74A]EAA30347.2 hypothetical protein NCU02189 [Neurospora crassa OR74A]KHE84049.1 hypothetical protein GE21DRAFT_10535 [Neurospora crassa]|eukprot:XP_959583.2 hypothetical protein NCU02189 [Neurospora crassa OR74A]